MINQITEFQHGPPCATYTAPTRYHRAWIWLERSHHDRYTIAGGSQERR